MKKPTHQAGFTLVEAILVIVITGILAGMVGTFIRIPIQSYVDSVARAELSDAADTALRRISRDLRLALPNSVRVSADGRYLEMILTKTGGRYLSEDDGIAGNVLQFEVPGLNCAVTPNDPACSFTVLGAMPVAPLDIAAGDQIVVYNLGLDAANAYTGGNVASVRQVFGNIIALSNNPFALQVPALRSPTRRFQVIATPVTYFCDSQKANGGTGVGYLRRYSGYALTASQPTPPTGAGLKTALLADGVVECSFAYEGAANVHSGLMGLVLKMNRPGKASGTVQLYQQVHVDNTP